jgi:hypothetical protein
MLDAAHECLLCETGMYAVVVHQHWGQNGPHISESSYPQILSDVALRKEKPSDRPPKLFDERGLTRMPVFCLSDAPRAG